MSELITIINTVQKDHPGASFPKIVKAKDFDLSNFITQNSSFENVDVEHVKQTGCCDYGFHVQLAIPFCDHLIFFDYWD